VDLGRELFDTMDALRRHDPELSQVRAQRGRQHRALTHEQLAHAVNMSIACWSADFTATKRIVGRVTASAIASASAASVFSVPAFVKRGATSLPPP